jgi:transposase-like protein
MSAPIDEKTRAKVAAALLSGSGVSAVSRDLGVPKTTVSRIKNGLAAEQLEQIGTEKKERLEDLIAGYLSENFQTLSAQAIHARDKDWLRIQGAESLAILHGVMADKAIRILEAAAAAQPLPAAE